MDNVMLIGRLDKTTQEIFEKLAPLCHPQICVDNSAAVKGMLNMLSPYLVVASLENTEGDCEDMFYLLESAACRPTVIAIGSVEIQSKLIKSRYLPNKQVIFFQSPVKIKEIVNCVKGYLKEDAPEEDMRKKILVVDDDANTLRLMHKMLSERWNVSAVTSGVRAIMAIGKSKPDLILLDYDMPKINGKMTLELLRMEKETGGIPVVFLTGISDPERVKEVLELHPQGYLLKPTSEEKLISKLTEILG